MNKIINKENDMLKELRIEKSKGEDFDLILKKETESMPEGLGDYIRVNRKAKGYSLKDLEKVTDISASYINRLENGNRTNLTISMAHRLARGLEVPVKELLVRSKMEFKEDEMKRYEIMSEKSNIKSFGDLIKNSEMKEI
ncbi:MAG: helix-turn-helix domain-containing protein [Clostridiales bacterium]|nr:helix-turn-helix domain-containing protein [Clostridiales bacterium]